MDVNNILKDGERLDDLHRNNYKIIQHKDKFCFGIDAVLLSHFSKVHRNEKVLDLCTGSGIVPILIEAKSSVGKIVGVDIQEDIVDMASRSVALNGLQDKIDIRVCDVKNVFEMFRDELFDVITTNPPYMNNGSGFVNENDSVSIAKHEILCNLDDVVKASKLLKYGGKFYMVHRPNRLTDIFWIFRKYKVEPKTIRFVQPNLSKEPNIVLIEGIKGGKPMLNVLPNLVVYSGKNEYTKELRDIYYS